MKKCKCKRGCKVEVKGKDKIYARGHHPDCHSEERNKKSRKTLNKMFKKGQIKRYYGKENVSRRFEVRNKISAALKGKRKSEEHKQKFRDIRKKKYWATWPKGSEMPYDVWNKGLTKETHASIAKYARGMKALRKIKKWSNPRRGKKSPYPAWNKGLTKKTDKRVASYAKKLRGKQNHTGERKFLYSRYNKKIWMRSSWEVAYAKWLDKQKIEWLYEHKAFHVGESKKWNGTTYCPDFLSR